MKDQLSLFDEEPQFCIDTNVIVSFLRGTDEEHYGTDVFAPQWAFIEERIALGAIVAPRQVETELEKWCKKIKDMRDWLRDHRAMFLDVETQAQLESAKRIVNRFPVYGETQNYLGDLEVMTLAEAWGLAVVTLEGEAQVLSPRRPKIPNVCREFGIECLSVSGFLRKAGFGKSSET